MSNHTTIKDIARALGISTSTVSRALSDAWDVKRETREQVLAMAKKLRYHPNLNAKNLQNKRTGTIGIIIPEFVNSFFPNVVLGIQEVLYQENYHMFITQSNENREQELDNLRLLQEHNVEGIIMSITNEGGNEEAYKEVMDGGMPLVFFNRCPKTLAAPKVLIDDSLMAEKAVEHLIGAGRTDIWHLAGPINLEISAMRTEGYANALRRHGMDPEGKAVTAGIFIDDGRAAMERILDAGGALPDAVFCFNDPVAIGAMKALKNAGKRVPEDVAIVGFSEGSMAKVVEPQLTTVLQPMKEMGRQAALLLLEQLQAKRSYAPRTVCLDAKLNIRASSATNA
ncbi:MAG: LacI family transcriptional regulator [Muribaculaceae bacterium]|nr:LacI family transcriptional regulator [Muribaculaceae bacterium]